MKLKVKVKKDQWKNVPKGLLFCFFKGKSNCHKDGDWWQKQTPRVRDVIYQQETFLSCFKTVIILTATPTKALTLRWWLKCSKKVFFFFYPTCKWKYQTIQAVEQKETQQNKRKQNTNYICQISMCLKMSVCIHICWPSAALTLFKSQPLRALRPPVWRNNEPRAAFSGCSSSLHAAQMPALEPLAGWRHTSSDWFDPGESGRKSQNASFPRTKLQTSTHRAPVWQGCGAPVEFRIHCLLQGHFSIFVCSHL